MSLSEAEELELLELENENARAKSGGVRDRVVRGLKKADQVAGSVLRTGLETVNAPFEVVGEALRLPVEGAPLSDFRAPTIVQKALDSTKTEEPPANPFSVINRSVRGLGGFVTNLPEGMDSAIEAAKAAYNEERGTMGVIEDTALGLLLGKVAPNAASAPLDATVKGAGALAKGSKAVATAAGKKAIRAGLGPSEEAITAMATRPDAVKSAKNFDDLADDFADTLNKMGQKLDEYDEQAWNSLLKLKAEPRSKLVNMLKEVKRDFIGTGKTKISNADRAAASQIDKYVERLMQITQKGSNPKTEQMLDQRQLRELIQSIRRDARFDLPDNDPTNLAVMAAQAKLDKYLKTENPQYAEIMEPFARATSALKDAARKFKLGRKKGEGYVSSDTTASKLRTLGGDRKPETDRVLANLKRETGRDFQDEAQLTRFKGEFKPGERSRGSARTLAGGIIGTGTAEFLGLPPLAGTVTGGAMGRLADYYGGPMAETLLSRLAQGRGLAGSASDAVKASGALTPFIELLQTVRRAAPGVSPLISRMRR